MEKQCECHVMSFPATTDQCHWIAVAGTNSIVRYGLGSCGRYEGTVLQEIKVDCGIDDRSSIVICKKGKAWEIFLATSHGKLRSYGTSPSSNGQPLLKKELPVVKVFETDKKTTSKMDDATLSFSRTGAKLGAILVNGTYIWNTQTAKLLKVLAMTSVGVDFATFSPELDYIACSDLKDRDQVLV
ncbi:uncharacterized protein [Acropora muricata]|uniref:uncharacterized protein n=1 Tax=Acropora muricata TaxID=159855 RepID=UPI0034E4D895